MRISGKNHGRSEKEQGRGSAESRWRIRVRVRAAFRLLQSEVADLMKATLLHYDTIQRWMNGYPVNRGNEERLEAALRRLGFEKKPAAPPGAPRRRIVSVRPARGKAA